MTQLEMDWYGDTGQESQVTLGDLEAVCRECYEIKSKIEELKDQESELNDELKKKQEKIILILENHKKDNYESAYGKVIVVERSSVRIPSSPEEKEAFFNYLKERGLFESMVNINSQTLNAFYKKEEEIALTVHKNIDFKIPGISAPKYTKTLTMNKAKGKKK